MTMIKNLINHYQKEPIKDVIKVDTQQFNDPIADIIEWHKVIPGGKKYATHTLKKNSAFSYKYTCSKSHLFFNFIVIFAGIIMILLGWDVFFDIKSDLRKAGWVFFGLLTLFVGVFFLLVHSIAITFDKKIGLVWKGRCPQSLAGRIKEKTKAVYFSDIHAVQVVKEYIKPAKSKYYYVYEINLILKDGTRFQVIDHGIRNQILQDAKILSHLINVPLWNTI